MLTRGLLGALATTVLVLACAASAQASSITQIPSYTDSRGAMPNHPGTLWKALYGPFTIPAATSPSQPGQVNHATTTEPAPPCAPACRITDMMPELIFTDGTTANMQQGILLHHFVFFNPANQALACTNPMSEPFWGSGNERTPLHLPSPYGYENTSANWSMLTHLVNLNTQAKNVYVQVVYRTRPLSETQPTRPVVARHRQLLQRGQLRVHDPAGLLRHTRRLDLDRRRTRDQHVGPPARCRHHGPHSVPDALRGGRRRHRAVS